MEHILALFDFSPHSAAALKAAWHWSTAANARLHIYHHAQLLLPSLTPDDLKKSWAKEQAQETKKEVKGAVQHLLGPDASFKVHVSTGKFLPFMVSLSDKYRFGAAFLGAKGRGVLSDLLSGSVVANIVSHFTLPIVAIQSNYDGKNGFDFLVNVDTQQAFPAASLKKLISPLGSSVGSLGFYGIVPAAGSAAAAGEKLRALAADFSDIGDCRHELSEGNEGDCRIREIAAERPGSIVVVQKTGNDYAKSLVGRRTVFDLIQGIESPVIILS